MKVRFVGVVLFVLAMVFAVGANAQVTKKQLVGKWSVVSVVNEQDGKKWEPFGPHPLGQFIFTLDGNFSINLDTPGRPKFASNNRLTGTAEENKAAMVGYQAQFGTYTIGPDGSITLHIVGSNFPNWDGVDLKGRTAQVKGDEMTWKNPGAAVGGSNVIMLKRAK